MGYKLFLDDERIPLTVFLYIDNNPIYDTLDWVVVRTGEQFKEVIISRGIPDTISFDNDIQDGTGDNEITGYKLAKWLVYRCIDRELKFPKEIMVHSQNIVDKPNISAIFVNALKIFPELKP